jgi:hypothetical protein
MANQIQRLPVIEWQPEPAPVNRTSTTATNCSTSKDYSFTISLVTVLAVLFGGLTIAGVISVNTDPYPQTPIHRSN